MTFIAGYVTGIGVGVSGTETEEDWTAQEGH
jgi:hypothetical protein